MANETIIIQGAEAPYSVNTHAVSPRGFSMQFTVRDCEATRFMSRLNSLECWLVDNGWQPAAAAPASPSPANNGHAEDSSAKICPIHGAKMTRREKAGDTWYSHKAYRPDGTEYWCRGEEK